MTDDVRAVWLAMEGHRALDPRATSDLVQHLAATAVTALRKHNEESHD
jgi:hypothetical protein